MLAVERYRPSPVPRDDRPMRPRNRPQKEVAIRTGDATTTPRDGSTSRQDPELTI